jgi:hypothetical protein
MSSSPPIMFKDSCKQVQSTWDFPVIPKLRLDVPVTVPHAQPSTHLSPRSLACLSPVSLAVNPTSRTNAEEFQKRLMTPRGRRQSLKINSFPPPPASQTATIPDKLSNI